MPSTEIRAAIGRFRLHVVRDPSVALKRTLLYAIAHPIRYRTRRSCTNDGALPIIVWCDPSRITRNVSLPEPIFSTVRGHEPIIGCCSGVWDLFTDDMREWTLYRSIRERYLAGKEWEDTEYYRRIRSVLDRGYETWGCESPADLRERCRALDRLHERIEERGYPPQTTKTSFSAVSIPDELRVGIDRTGSLVRTGGGKHRLFLAQVLDVERIPILVTIVHDRWHRLESHADVRGAIESVPHLHRDDHPFSDTY